MLKFPQTLSFIALFICFLSQSQGQVIRDEAGELGKNSKLQDADTLDGWKFNGFTALNFSQIALNNWAAGGTGSYSALATVQLGSRYRKGDLLWQNNLNLNYGLVKADGSELQKSDDRIEFISRLGYKAFGNWYYAGFASFRTQHNATFQDGQLVSNFMSPAWLQFALGLSYSKNEHFSFMIAPVAGKYTFVNDQRLADSGAYGVDGAVIDPVTFAVITPGKNFRPELGAYMFATASIDLMKNITLSTRLDLFNNYSDPNKPNRKNIDVNWETSINMKVNEFISASIFTHLIYDNDILITLPGGENKKGPRTQFKEVLGVGLSYKFGS